MTRTILAIAEMVSGDTHATRLRHALSSQQQWLAERGCRIVHLSYRDVHQGVLVPRDAAGALLFFPHHFWQLEVEGQLPGLYGMPRYGQALQRYIADTTRALAKQVPDIRYVNDPAAVALTRDKGAVKQQWLRAGVPTPPPVSATSPAGLRRAIDTVGCVFAKAPCASMGKGIAMLSRERWTTNFAYSAGTLSAPVPGHPQYHGTDQWAFADVEVGDERFLAALLAARGFLFEVGFARPLLGQARVELRVTVIAGRVVQHALYLGGAGAATTSAADTTDAPAPPEEALRSACAAAAEAAAALHLSYAVLDVVFHEDWSPYVIDAQAFPALGTSPDIFRQILTTVTGEPA